MGKRENIGDIYDARCESSRHRPSLFLFLLPSFFVNSQHLFGAWAQSRITYTYMVAYKAHDYSSTESFSFYLHHGRGWGVGVAEIPHEG
jgi:hypothetical protein